MQSKATTVEQYLAELPADRRGAIESVRAVILKHLDLLFEEGMQYGMIGYYVPHRVFPAGYESAISTMRSRSGRRTASKPAKAKDRTASKKRAQPAKRLPGATASEL